jgi:hypothetical protein
MQLTNYRTTASGNTAIYFPSLECWNSMTNVATIAAQMDKRRVLCRISLKTLRDKFGASEADPMQSVDHHRTAIQEAARKLIENEVYEEDGSILIRAHDL